MKKIINLTKIEDFEESIYNVGMMTSISFSASSALIFIHMLISSQVFSYLFFTITIVSFFGYFLFSHFKNKRFGNKNFSLGERIVRIEEMLGKNI